MPTNRELSIETDIIWWMNEKLYHSDWRIKLSDLVQIEWCVLMKKRESYLHKKKCESYFCNMSGSIFKLFYDESRSNNINLTTKSISNSNACFCVCFWQTFRKKIFYRILVTDDLIFTTSLDKTARVWYMKITQHNRDRPCIRTLKVLHNRNL